MKHTTPHQFRLVLRGAVPQPGWCDQWHHNAITVMWKFLSLVRFTVHADLIWGLLSYDWEYQAPVNMKHPSEHEKRRSFRAVSDMEMCKTQLLTPVGQTMACHYQRPSTVALSLRTRCSGLILYCARILKTSKTPHVTSLTCNELTHYIGQSEQLTQLFHFTQCIQI